MLNEIVTLAGFLIFLSSILLFASLILWALFGKWYPKMLYGSLLILGASVYFWSLSAFLVDGMAIQGPQYRFETNLPFPKLMKAIFVTGLFAIIYATIALITAVARCVLQRSYRQLVYYSVWALVLGLLVMFWQGVSPCAYTLLGCEISNWPSVPVAPIQ